MQQLDESCSTMHPSPHDTILANDTYSDEYFPQAAAKGGGLGLQVTLLASNPERVIT